ncbi:hypothetical protein Hanom_Chr07g00601901 [Helianthus anomalus]
MQFVRLFLHAHLGEEGWFTSDRFYHSHCPIKSCHVINQISITSDRNVGGGIISDGIPMYKY